MNYIKLNDMQMQVISFNRYVNFNNGVMSGSCNCQVVTSDLSGLQELGTTPVTSIQIIHDDQIIYNLTDIETHVASINETLVEDHIDISLTFDF